MSRLSYAFVFVAFARLVTAEDIDQRSPQAAVTALDVADGLEATLIASEPMLKSPSNIDVDHLGRIWVCEVVNYRHFANKNNPAREEGDRIAVLEDTDGDGVMDKDTTFYQGRDIDSAHGVCVLGNRVIVSAGENVFNFYDDDGDLKADRKEVMFTGIKGAQHDHGIHSFTFGPDGRLYFNFGNNGKELHNPDGSFVVDVAGNEVKADRKPYQEGMAFRCELDGSKVDTLGWNFRNNWELCVDSFGTVWQSDNDDDGNKGVRINYVMEYGNYGYKDELTGAGWRERRTNMEATIPEQHWHLNDPGVVPNLLQTGAGSPTGILIYEGDLLPERFRNQLIHCDAGPNVVRSYAVENDGAGYKATINPILKGARDQWFRPSDVCVAPDGSLIVADWYDPGVGGHRQGDIHKGRLFRVAPNDSKYSVPKLDLETLEGAVQALKSPNVATRYLAYQKLKSAGMKSQPLLAAAFKAESDPRLQARILWLAAACCEDNDDSQLAMAMIFDSAVKHENPNLRITGMRIARRFGINVNKIAAALANDESPQVRREVAIALRHAPGDEEIRPHETWGQLAGRYPPGDRWYLEALGIAIKGDWNVYIEEFDGEFLSKVVEQGGNPMEDKRLKDFVWRARAKTAPSNQANFLLVAAVQPDPDLKYIKAMFRALDFQDQAKVKSLATEMLAPEIFEDLDTKARSLVVAETLKRAGEDLSKVEGAEAALDIALADLQGTSEFIQLIQRFHVKDRYPALLTLAQSKPSEQIGIEAIRSLLQLKQWDLLRDSLNGEDTKAALATAAVLGNSRDGAIPGALMSAIKNDNTDLEVRRAAVRAMAQANRGAQMLVELHEAGDLSSSLTQAAAAALHASPSRGARESAARLFPLPPGKEGKPLPPMNRLIGMKSDAKNGRLVFHTTGTCHKCHVVGKLGRDIGPDLSEIGSKLSRSVMFESILYPSAGISHNYETWTLILENGTSQSGLLVSETDSKLSLKGDDGIVRDFAADEIDEKVKQRISLMPADLQKIMTAQEIVDVVGYMQSLRKTTE